MSKQAPPSYTASQQQPGGPAPVSAGPRYKEILVNEKFNCLEDKNLCIYSCFCPCLQRRETWGLRDNADASWLYPCLYTCGCVFFWPLMICSTYMEVQNRAKTHRVLGVPEEHVCANCLFSLCCGCCAAYQEQKAVADWHEHGRINEDRTDPNHPANQGQPGQPQQHR